MANQPTTPTTSTTGKETTMDAQREMPRYKCHKEVWALKIKEIIASETTSTDGGAIIVPEEEGYASFEVNGDYMRKHEPLPGGYYVVYNDGYKSFSPAKAFEEGYTKV